MPLCTPGTYLNSYIELLQIVKLRRLRAPTGAGDFTGSLTAQPIQNATYTYLHDTAVAGALLPVSLTTMPLDKDLFCSSHLRRRISN